MIIWLLLWRRGRNMLNHNMSYYLTSCGSPIPLRCLKAGIQLNSLRFESFARLLETVIIGFYWSRNNSFSNLQGDDDAYLCINEDHHVTVSTAYLKGRRPPVLDSEVCMETPKPFHKCGFEVMNGTLLLCAFILQSKCKQSIGFRIL